MSYDAQEVCRLLDDLEVPYVESDNGHLVRWKADGLVCEYAGRIYGGRTSRLTVHGIAPKAAIDALFGERGPECKECEVR